MRTFSIVVVFVLAAAACGGSGADSTTTTTTTTTVAGATTTTTAPAATTTAGEAAETTTTVSSSEASCDHSHFPVRAGSAWTFRNAQGEEITWEIVSVADDGRSAVMEAVLPAPGGTVTGTINIACDETGISAPELAITGLPQGAVVLSAEEDGVFLLPAGQLVEGAMWTSVVNLTAELEGEVRFEMQRTSMFTVIGMEEVTVEAGTFNAVKIRAEFELEILTGGVPIGSSGAEDIWFAEGVGLVLESEVVEPGAQPSFSNELVEYTVP